MVINTSYIKRLILFGYLISLLLGGITAISIGDRTPALLYADLFLLILALQYIARFFHEDSAAVIDQPILILSMLYILSQMVSLLINQSDFFKGMLSIKIFLNGFLIYFIILSLYETERDIDWITYNLVFFAAILSLILIFKFGWGSNSISYSDLTKGMISTRLGDSNYLASFLTFFAPISLGLAVANSQLSKRVLFTICFVLMLLALIVTMSKGAALGLAIALGIVLPSVLRLNARIKYIVVLATIILCVNYLVPLVIPDAFIGRNIESIEYRIQNPDYSRSEMVKLAWEDFLAKPLFGMGPYQSFKSSRYENMPHNFILQVLAELGIFGGIPFLLIIVIFLLRSYKLNFNARLDKAWKNEYAFFFAGIIGTLIHGMLELTFQGAQYMTVFWIFMAVIYLKTQSQGDTL